MKKAIKKIAIISGAVTVVMFAVNLIIGLMGGDIIGAFRMAGGEMISYAGFGVRQKTIVPLSTPDDPGVGSTHVCFEPATFIGTFLACMAAGCIIYFVCRLIRAKKSKAAEQNNEA